MQKHEIFTSQEGLDLMDFVNFQVEQGISLARRKGHKYYAYSLEFKIDEERTTGYIAIPMVKDFSSNSTSEIVDQCSHYSVATLAEITRNQTPWIKARNSVFKEISLESLYEFFKEQ